MVEDSGSDYSGEWLIGLLLLVLIVAVIATTVWGMYSMNQTWNEQKAACSKLCLSEYNSTTFTLRDVSNTAACTCAFDCDEILCRSSARYVWNTYDRIFVKDVTATKEQEI